MLSIENSAKLLKGSSLSSTTQQ
uniref:Uncharacterized protein n=1 Tax=Moniliophthora roreri TaxID=221103 RepID=A0A0W0G0Y9_MONRR